MDFLRRKLKEIDDELAKRALVDQELERVYQSVLSLKSILCKRPSS
jgi:hypothetical protein